jgi:hypothetical protein
VHHGTGRQGDAYKIRRGQEGLGIGGHPREQGISSRWVEFAEDIVEKQKRSGSVFPGEEVGNRQLEG